MLLLACLTACLVNNQLYEQRLAELTDDDGDGFDEVGGDCDDRDALASPTADEVCDGEDNDCDGTVDEDAVDAVAWWTDADRDGFGAAPGGADCHVPDGAVTAGSDCDDDHAAIHPEAEEVPYDDVDQDCEGGDLDDVDGDGHAAEQTGGDDCDDTDAATHAGADEAWADGWTDNDCDHAVDPLVLEYGADAWSSPTPGAGLGSHLAVPGDLDGDGWPELLAAGVGSDDVVVDGGIVYAFPSADVGEWDTVHRIEPTVPGMFLGVALSSGFDQDGDGVSDVLVSAIPPNSAGAVYLVDGRAIVAGDAPRLPEDAWAIVEGVGNDTFWDETAWLGDIDGDGVGEFAISAATLSIGLDEDVGAVAIVPATLLDEGAILATADAEATWSGGFAGAYFGSTVNSIGDVDGDGRDDVLVGSRYGVLATVMPGITGDASSDDAAWSTLVNSGAAGTEAFRSVPIGDVDDDGVRDFATLGTDLLFVTTDHPIAALMIETDSFLRLDTPPGTYFFDALGLGDCTGDGRDELLVSANYSTEWGTAWMGLVSPDGFSTVDTTALSFGDIGLTAVSARSQAGHGYRIARVDHGDNSWVAAGGPDDSLGGDFSGSVALLELPRCR